MAYYDHIWLFIFKGFGLFLSIFHLKLNQFQSIKIIQNNIYKQDTTQLNNQTTSKKFLKSQK